MKLRYCYIVWLLLVALSAEGQIQIPFISVRGNKPVREGGPQQPDYVLVQLPTQHARLKLLEQRGATKEAEKVRKDVTNISSAIRSDFKDNFRFCAAYFFADTALQAISAHNFAGRLHTADGNLVNDLPAADSLFYILQYSYPIEHLPNVGYLPKDIDPQTGARGNFRRWMAMTYDGRQAGYIYLPNPMSRHMPTGAAAKPNRYRAKAFDYDYYPWANKVDEMLQLMLPRNR